MRIVMLSDYEAKGGAAIAATRLERALTRAGEDVWRFVFEPSSSSDRARGLVSGLTASLLGVRGVRRTLAPMVVRRALIEALDQIAPDVVNIHNLHGGAHVGWGVELVRACASRAPTVWTLHDMWSFTGRCAYAGGCRSFLSGCTASCPTPGEYPALAPSRIEPAWRRRQALLHEHPSLTAATPSRWLAAEARGGMWSGHRVEVIPNGIPLTEYVPYPRGEARAALGLPPSTPVLLAAAADLTERRKGVDLLRDALPHVRTRPLVLALMGTSSATQRFDGVQVAALGHVAAPARQALVYSAADLLVHSARADNLPNTVVESIACGTPALAFRVGGLVDLVRPGRTGWLVESVDAESLARGIDRALADIADDDLRRSCRSVAESEYGADLQATRYVRLFEELMAEKP